MLSPNLGIRNKHLDKNSNKYSELKELLKKIYEHTKPQFKTNDIYHYLMGIDNHDILINDVMAYESLLQNLSATHPKWKEVRTSIWSGWIQVVYANKSEQSSCSPAKPTNIKVYVCLEDKDAAVVFVESIKHLLKNANNTFAAKISTLRRNDQICYWVSPEDFRHLEDFFAPMYNNLIESIPFIAYKNKLGISKDFPGTEISHNPTMAHIISDYLKNVQDVESINLEAMYNNYIAKWNADIWEDTYDSFKDCSILSFVVIMDTLDAILGNRSITNNSLMFSDKKELWYMLSDCRCWAELNDVIVKARYSSKFIDSP